MFSRAAGQRHELRHFLHGGSSPPSQQVPAFTPHLGTSSFCHCYSHSPSNTPRGHSQSHSFTIEQAHTASSSFTCVPSWDQLSVILSWDTHVLQSTSWPYHPAETPQHPAPKGLQSGEAWFNGDRQCKGRHVKHRVCSLSRGVRQSGIMLER